MGNRKYVWVCSEIYSGLGETGQARQGLFAGLRFFGDAEKSVDGVAFWWKSSVNVDVAGPVTTSQMSILLPFQGQQSASGDADIRC